MSALTLRVVPAIADIAENAWDALLDDHASPFLEWTWLEALEHSGCVSKKTGCAPAHLTLWRGEALVAAAPAYVKEHSNGEFVYDWSWASAAERAGIPYYPKLILAVPLTPATGRRVLVHRDQDRAEAEKAIAEGALALARELELSSVHVLFPVENEADHFGGLGFGIRTGVQYHWKNGGFATYDDFLAGFASKRRNQLKRERREVAAAGIRLRTRRGPELSGGDADLVFRLYCSTVDKYMWGRRYLNKAFFKRVLERFSRRVEVVEALHEGKVIAGAFNVASATHLYGRYWGCFEEHPFLHFEVCLYHSIDECIRRGIKQFEGGAGGEHKLSRGFVPSLTKSAHFIFDPRLDAAIRDFVLREHQEIVRGLPEWHAMTGLKKVG